MLSLYHQRRLSLYQLPLEKALTRIAIKKALTMKALTMNHLEQCHFGTHRSVYYLCHGLQLRLTGPLELRSLVGLMQLRLTGSLRFLLELM